MADTAAALPVSVAAVSQNPADPTAGVAAAATAVDAQSDFVVAVSSDLVSADAVAAVAAAAAAVAAAVVAAAAAVAAAVAAAAHSVDSVDSVLAGLGRGIVVVVVPASVVVVVVGFVTSRVLTSANRQPYV